MGLAILIGIETLWQVNGYPLWLGRWPRGQVGIGCFARGLRIYGCTWHLDILRIEIAAGSLRDNGRGVMMLQGLLLLLGLASA